MTLINHCQQALINLMAAKLRSFLAVLGILVGTAAVVALISCGQLATEKALAQFKVLGTDLLSVSVYQNKVSNNSSTNEQISLGFWRKFPAMISDVLQIAPYSTVYQPISFQGKSLNGVVVGADEALASIINIELAEGKFVSINPWVLGEFNPFSTCDIDYMPQSQGGDE